MSGPSCKTCKHFRDMPMGDWGECHDTSKIIYREDGKRHTNRPEVLPSMECLNHRRTED